MFDTYVVSPLPARVSAAFSAEALDRLQAAGVTGLTGSQQVEADDDSCLPLPEALQGLFPSGLRRGWTVTVDGSSSLVLALLAETSKKQGWCAEVGSPLLGSTAAAEAGVVLERFVRVAEPGEQWATVAASLLEAFDVVVVHPPRGGRAGGDGRDGRGVPGSRVASADMRRLSARARERDAVLLVTGAWEGAMVGLSITGQRWHGLGSGHGYLRSREIEVSALGRGAAVRPRQARLWLPARDGGLALRQHAA
jgi:hypothetical protein